MKVVGVVFVLVAVSAAASPVGKVLDMLSNFEAKIMKDGEEAKAIYAEAKTFCEDRSRQLAFEIKTGETQISELNAHIESKTATISALSSKIDGLATSIVASEADLKGATEVRGKEAADFVTEEKNLLEVIDTIRRAVGILKRELAKGVTSLLQGQSVVSLAEALSAMVDASVLSSADAARLTTLAKHADSDDSDEGDLGAPAAAVYKSHGSDIIATLEGLQDKAESQLAEAREHETNSLHSFQLLEQGLEDQIKFANSDLSQAKKDSGAAAESRAMAEKDLSGTTADLNEDTTEKAELDQDCTTKAADFEAASKSRSEELAAIAEAKKAIVAATGGAEAQVYTQATSFLQMARVSRSQASTFEVSRFVRTLAKKQGSAELAQLASRISSILGSTNVESPFAKVQGLIEELIARLESEASADASHKAFCDSELSESSAKEAELKNDEEKLSTKIDQAASASAHLKEEVTGLQKALSDLASSQSQMDKIRQEEQAAFLQNKQEMEMGIEAVKQALKILRDYYSKADKAHEAGDGTASGIVSLLEVVESDFSKSLVEMTTTEETSARDYDQTTKENAIVTATKSKDVEYKEKEAASLDKAVSELSNDRANVQQQLDAVMEYLAQLRNQCIAKAETYGERVGKRAAEIQGLKEALEILESEAVLLQRRSRRSGRSALRGALQL